MNVRAQLSLRQISIFVVFGILLLLIIGIYLSNFFDFDIFQEIQQMNVSIVLVYLITSIALGDMFSNASWRYLDSLLIATPKGIFQRVFGRFVLGILPEEDYRTTPYKDHKELKTKLTNKISEVFDIDFDTASEASKREIYFLVSRYVENNLSDKSFFTERFHIKANFYSAMLTLSLVALVFNSISLYFYIAYNEGNLNLWTLLGIEAVILIFVRYIGIHFKRRMIMWRDNVWRYFLVLTSPTSSHS